MDRTWNRESPCIDAITLIFMPSLTKVEKIHRSTTCLPLKQDHYHLPLSSSSCSYLRHPHRSCSSYYMYLPHGKYHHHPQWIHYDYYFCSAGRKTKDVVSDGVHVPKAFTIVRLPLYSSVSVILHSFLCRRCYVFIILQALSYVFQWYSRTWYLRFTLLTAWNAWNSTRFFT